MNYMWVAAVVLPLLGIGMTQVIALFVIGLSVEEKLRQRDSKRKRQATADHLRPT
jgi:hypothetical protein